MHGNLVLGIDGCKTGWIAAAIHSSAIIEVELFTHLTDLWKQYQSVCALLLIDMPIGLIDQGTEGRECDRLARRLLSPHRHSSIFTPPCRTALYAPATEAADLNFAHTGKRLSKQTINIMPKMRETDSWLQQLPPADRQKIKESHPEVVFAALNGGQALHYNKKKPEGKTARIAVLKKYFPKVEGILEQARAAIPRKMAQTDDLIDALALAVAAQLALDDPKIARSLPIAPPMDAMGLPMQIFYVEAK